MLFVWILFRKLILSCIQEYFFLRTEVSCFSIKVIFNFAHDTFFSQLIFKNHSNTPRELPLRFSGISEFIYFGLSAILFIIFWQFVVLTYKCNSPQLTRNLISSIKNFVLQLPREIHYTKGEIFHLVFLW